MTRTDEMVAADPEAGANEAKEAKEVTGAYRRHARPALWTQLTIIAVGLWLYDWINNLSPLRQSVALVHGTQLVRLETRLHLNPELSLNHWLAVHGFLARLVADEYDLAHFIVTLAILTWIWWRRPGQYRFLRNALIGINAIGLIVFWVFPVAPPRMLSSFGFIDIVAVTHAVGAWSSGALGSQANEYAAMPSLHMAWALWCTIAVWAATTRRPVRLVAGIYAVTTGIVVIATANHYFLDVAAGAAAAAAAAAAAWTWEQQRRGRWQPQRSRRRAAAT